MYTCTLAGMRSPVVSLVLRTSGLKSAQIPLLCRSSRSFTTCMARPLKHSQPIGLKPLHLNQILRQRCSGRLPFDIDPNVVKDTLVFSCHNATFYRMISIFGVVQFVFWGNLALFAYSGLKDVGSEELKGLFTTDSFWGKILEYQARYKGKIAAICASLGKAAATLHHM